MEQTVFDILALLKTAVSFDVIASKNGFLQRREPRFKIVAFAFFLAAIIVSRSAITIFMIYLVVLALVAISSVGLVFFLKRTMIFIPLFSLFIVIPAVFDFVTPGIPVVSFSFFGSTVSITQQGLASAGVFFLRVLVSVSLTILLSLTTKQHVLLRTLRIFRVPQLFVMITGMTYRYIYLLLDIAQNMFTAVKSRVGTIRSSRTGQNIVGSNMGQLWLQSYRLQTQVYSAMISRGYTGEPRVIDEFHANKTDYLFLLFSILVLTGTLCINFIIR